MFNARVVYHDSFEGKGFTDENSLANMFLTNPDELDMTLTFLMGQESKMFPLTFLSEGQEGGSWEVNDIEYKYSVMGKINRADTVALTAYSGSNKPGLARSKFKLPFKTNWFKYQHTIESNYGDRARIVDRPVYDGSYHWYELELIANSDSAFCSLASCTEGARWVMLGGANVSASRSEGNESNAVAPGKMKNQLSILRKSYRIAGNMGNKTVELRLMMDGKETSMWLPFEQWQHINTWKKDYEEHIWTSTYNRMANGQIYNTDKFNNLPIPMMAGVEEQIPNWDTYSTLTAKKLKNTVRDVMFGATDTGKMDVILFTGLGGMEEADNALKSEAAGFNQVIGDKFVRGSSGSLILGGYFRQYEHTDGHVITIKHLPWLDHGSRALVANKHPKTGLPITSYTMYFIDQSRYDGHNNVVGLHERGRSFITGILNGMAAAPDGFTGNAKNVRNIATDRDESSVHVLATKSILLRRNTHCFGLTCSLS